MGLTWDERKAKYLDVMKNEYRGRTAKFERNGHTYYAEFDQGSIRKPVYGDNRSSPNGVKALIKAGADGDVFDLVENSEYRRSRPNTKDHTDADYFDYFVKTVQIDGKVFDLVADVEKKYGDDGGYVYTLALTDNKKIKASPTHGTPNNGPVKNVGNAFSDDIISQNSEKSSGSTKFSLSDPNTENNYLDAAKRGDTQTAQKIVDDVAKEAGYSVKAFHGGDKFFTEFGKGNKTSMAPEGADIDAEITADLVGDYLFDDNADFINNLSVKNRNVFKKIYDEIKYLYKLATAGSKEKRQLEKVKRAFDKAYKADTKASAEGADTKFSVSDKNNLDKSRENSYNLYTNSNEYQQEVTPRDKFTFARSLANNTSDMADGDYKLFHIKCYDKIYCFSADGYMHGRIVHSKNVDSYKAKERGIDEYSRNWINKDREIATLWAESVQGEQGGYEDDSVILGRGRSNSSDTLPKNSYERYTPRYNERDREAFESKAERDEIIRQLRELYGLDTKESNGALEQTQTNEIAPNKASSEDGVFFDAENTKYSLSEDSEAPKRRGRNSIMGEVNKVLCLDAQDSAKMAEILLDFKKTSRSKTRQTMFRSLPRIYSVLCVHNAS